MTEQNGVERSSATEVLRRLLDERGVEWMPVAWNPQRETFYHAANGVGFCADEYTDGVRIYTDATITPEQAIAATLGTGTCHNASKIMDEHGQARFACSECGAWIDSRMLWNPEYRNGESPWVSDCKLNYCPNCGRRIEVVDE